jgi:nicotinamidase-related amidase
VSQHLANQRYGWGNGDEVAKPAAWLVLHRSGRRTAFPAFLRTSMHSRLVILGGVRTLSDSNRTRPQQLTIDIKESKNTQDLNQLLLQQKATVNHIHVSAAWSKFKTMRRGGDRRTRIGLLLVLQELTESQMQNMDGRQVANILHAITKGKAAGTASIKQLVQKLMAKATTVSQSFEPQHVANTVWALATMGVTPDAGLLRAMQVRATAVAGEFNPQNVANTLSALAKMGVTPDAGLLRAMQVRAMALAGEFTPQAVSNTVWALATMGVTPDEELLRAMQVRAMALAGLFDPQEVSNTVWALATMGVTPDEELLRAMQVRATSLAGLFDPQNVANTVWALATMGVMPEAGLLRAMQGRATATAGLFNPQDVANTVWAHACFGVPCGKGEQEMFEILATRVLEVSSKMDPKDECQVHQWLLTFDLEPSWDLSSLAQVNVVKQELGERCRRSFVREDPGPSKLQVARSLALISWHVFPNRYRA